MGAILDYIWGVKQKKRKKNGGISLGKKIGGGASTAIKERKRKERELLKSLMED